MNMLQTSSIWASRSGRVAQHASFDFKRLRKLKKIRPGPVPAGLPYGALLEKARRAASGMEFDRKLMENSSVCRILSHIYIILYVYLSWFILLYLIYHY